MTDAQYKLLIIDETGIRDEMGNIAYPLAYNSLAIWWQMAADRGKSQWLAYLYTKQAVLRYILGTLRRAKDVVIGPDQIRAGQMFNNALRELQEWNAFIGREDPDSQGVPVLKTIGVKIQAGSLDVVEEALAFAKQIDPLFAGISGIELALLP